MPVIDIYANVEGRDLGAVSDAVARIVKDMQSSLPRGTTVSINGQSTTMHAAYAQLLDGLALSIVLVYLLMVINFQSWLDPLIILMALPGALAGILWMLFVTQTTINVPSLMGAIMSIGVATANSILMITFANDAAPGGRERPRRRARGRHDPPAARHHDGARHDHRHAADVARPRRGRRAERPARPRGHRRPAGRHLCHAASSCPVVYSRLRYKALETKVEDELKDQ